jgi:hypothetical protein
LGGGFGGIEALWPANRPLRIRTRADKLTPHKTPLHAEVRILSAAVKVERARARLYGRSRPIAAVDKVYLPE